MLFSLGQRDHHKPTSAKSAYKKLMKLTPVLQSFYQLLTSSFIANFLAPKITKSNCLRTKNPTHKMLVKLKLLVNNSYIL